MIRISRPAFISLFSTAIFSFVITQQITTVAFTAQKTETLAFIALRRDSSNYISNLYTVQANGLFRHQLSEKLNVEPTVVWSKNGRKLAFVSDDTNIFVVNADGSRLTSDE
jgi:Tol biopolymer transport system component